ncbi:MAG: hypothetical protein ACLP50_10550, partial [Solirubrobacteraceae bacterium]
MTLIWQPLPGVNRRGFMRARAAAVLALAVLALLLLVRPVVARADTVSSYTTAVLADSPSMYFHLDAAGAQDSSLSVPPGTSFITDVTGHVTDATVSPGATFDSTDPGALGSSDPFLEVDGSAETINVPSADLPSGGSSQTVEEWVQVASSDADGGWVTLAQENGWGLWWEK